jgi:hypothetical protein
MMVVEFQPSRGSGGSYLNVRCMWLWNVKPYKSFDVGYRVETFYAFENGEQFNGVAERLATPSFGEGERLSRALPDLSSRFGLPHAKHSEVFLAMLQGFYSAPSRWPNRGLVEDSSAPALKPPMVINSG